MSALPPIGDIAGKPDASQQSWDKVIELVIKLGYIMGGSRFCGASPMLRVSKTDQIRSAWATGDRIGALRIAAQFFDRSYDTMTFQRGMDAYNHPDFYTQLGKEPKELVTAALALLQKRFDLR